MPDAAVDVRSTISANSGMILTFRRLCAPDVKRLSRVFCRSGIRQGVKILPDQPDRSAVATLDWRRSRQADEKTSRVGPPASDLYRTSWQHVPRAWGRSPRIIVARPNCSGGS